MKSVTEILIKPAISEKSQTLSEDLSKYVFEVHKKANKIQIKNAVEKMYGVNVKVVNTAILPGKSKVRQTKTGIAKGQTSSVKKAFVTLADGEAIDFYDNI